jgi:hypothetical protein
MATVAVSLDALATLSGFGSAFAILCCMSATGPFGGRRSTGNVAEAAASDIGGIADRLRQ